MKKIAIYTLIAVVFLTSCSKEYTATVAPPPPVIEVKVTANLIYPSLGETFKASVTLDKAIPEDCRVIVFYTVMKYDVINPRYITVKVPANSTTASVSTGIEYVMSSYVMNVSVDSAYGSPNYKFIYKK